MPFLLSRAFPRQGSEGHSLLRSSALTIIEALGYLQAPHGGLLPSPGADRDGHSQADNKTTCSFSRQRHQLLTQDPGPLSCNSDPNQAGPFLLSPSLELVQSPVKAFMCSQLLLLGLQLQPGKKNYSGYKQESHQCAPIATDQLCYLRGVTSL
jgi:hypothetical protein